MTTPDANGPDMRVPDASVPDVSVADARIASDAAPGLPADAAGLDAKALAVDDGGTPSATIAAVAGCGCQVGGESSSSSGGWLGCGIILAAITAARSRKWRRSLARARAASRRATGPPRRRGRFGRMARITLNHDSQRDQTTGTDSVDHRLGLSIRGEWLGERPVDGLAQPHGIRGSAGTCFRWGWPRRQHAAASGVRRPGIRASLRRGSRPGQAVPEAELHGVSHGSSLG